MVEGQLFDPGTKPEPIPITFKGIPIPFDKVRVWSVKCCNDSKCCGIIDHQYGGWWVCRKCGAWWKR